MTGFWIGWRLGEGGLSCTQWDCFPLTHPRLSPLPGTSSLVSSSHVASQNSFCSEQFSLHFQLANFSNSDHYLSSNVLLGLYNFLVMFRHSKIINLWVFMASCAYILTLPDLSFWYVLYFIQNLYRAQCDDLSFFE